MSDVKEDVLNIFYPCKKFKLPKMPWELMKNNYVHSRAYVPIICPFFLNGMCRGEESDCQYSYHTNRPWYWQFKQNYGQWSNIPIYHVQDIEEAFCDVSNDFVDLPYMRKKGTLKSGYYRVCFSSMTIINLDEPITCDIRRLSTKSSVIWKNKNGTTFQWFLKHREAEAKWEMIDSYRHIETQLFSLSTEPITFMHKESWFRLSIAKMVGKNLDTGEEVCVRRRPKRLVKATFPKKGKMCPTHSNNDKDSSCYEFSFEKILDPRYQGSECPKTEKDEIMTRSQAVPYLPQIWEMAGKKSEDRDGVIVVPLDPQCEEARQVRERVLCTLSNVRKVEVFGIQNPRMFHGFDNKMTELKRMNKKPWIHRLFHCPQADQIETICRDNFSPNLQMTNITQECGKGTYFFMSAAIAGSFCPEDPQGGRVLMLADVFIGDVTKGNPSLTGPPKKPHKGVVFSTCVAGLNKSKKESKNFNNVAVNDIINATIEDECDEPLILQMSKTKIFGQNSGEVFDTVVNDTDHPEKFVKYSKRDYYPRYILTYY